MYSFNRMRNHPEEDNHARFHPWETPKENLLHMSQGARAVSYAQCDLPKLAVSKTRLVFASSTPIEKGFFGLAREEEDHQPFIQEALRLFSGATMVKSLFSLIRRDPQKAAFELSGILRNQGPFRQIFQSLFMKYSMRRIRHMLSDGYDYWDEFLREYEYLKRSDGATHRADIEQITGGVHQKTSVEGCYHLVNDADQLVDIIEGTDSEIAFVLTIEGAHVIAVAPDQARADEALIFERVSALKALEHPVFFITIAHHFDNGLCGHAHSILDAGALVMNQSARMHTGFERENDLGRRVTRALLELSDDLEDLGGRRILIDSKHMSAQTRKEYYAEIINPFNAAREEGDRPGLPVIFSHACYSGVATLDELIADVEHETDHWHAPPFYAWNINVCDEDVRAVHASRGLIGLCFDQRVAGVSARQKIHPLQQARILMNHIFAIADVVMLDDRLDDDDKRTIWDRICIGSDYDGFIDPVSRYPTVLALPTFEEDLRDALEQRKHTRMIEALGVEALVEKICWRNAYDFAREHLPAAV